MTTMDAKDSLAGGFHAMQFGASLLCGPTKPSRPREKPKFTVALCDGGWKWAALDEDGEPLDWSRAFKSRHDARRSAKATVG